MTNNSRLKQLREHLGMSQLDFCTQAKIDKGNYSKMEKGTRPITSKTEQQIILNFDVNIEWWRKGKGEILTNSAISFPVHNRNRLKGKPLSLEVFHYDKVILHTGFDQGLLKKGSFLAIRKIDITLLVNEAFVVISHSKGVFVGKCVEAGSEEIKLADHKDRLVVIELKNVNVIYKIVGVVLRL